ncbi:hypothetical protein NKG94_32260 [Micromonospora sp. M12]
MPSLLIICDEFSELLAAKPDFIDLFVMIGRLGRSLGVHLLLASQRLEEGKLRGLDTHLSYRIGLRTFSAVESRIVLGVPDAYELPNAPGHGYLKTDTSTMLRFRAAYVSGRTGRRAAGLRLAGVGAAPDRAVRPRLRAGTGPADAGGGRAGARTAGRRQGRGDARRADRPAQGRGRPAHQVWLPPLADPPGLGELLGPLAVDPTYGLCTASWPGRGRLTVPVGVVDRPYEQRRDPMMVELAGAAATWSSSVGR